MICLLSVRTKGSVSLVCKEIGWVVVLLLFSSKGYIQVLV
jgi:hypothetical protein